MAFQFNMDFFKEKLSTFDYQLSFLHTPPDSTSLEEEHHTVAWDISFPAHFYKQITNTVLK